MSPEDGRREREARSVALERAYVHDVYDQISTHFSNTRYRAAWPKVKQFIQDLEPGSLVADIGCGNGKYMQTNSGHFNIGIDRCVNLANSARHRGNELMLSDNLCLPFRESSFDACLSIAVIHHFGTTERRVSALRELARILRIGGKLIITVWAMEQRHRKFESQDVLVPWHRPEMSLSDGKESSIDRDPNSTTTDEEDVMHYHACHQSDDSAVPTRSGHRRISKKRTRSRGGSNSAADGHNTTDEHDDEDEDDCCYASCARHCELHPHHKDSEATSPKESCYSFVRRALQKLTSSRRGSTGRSLIHGDSDWSPISDGSLRRKPKPLFTHGGSLDSQENLDDVPIELRHLEPDDPALLHIPPTPGQQQHLMPESPDSKSQSLSDLVEAHSPSPAPEKVQEPLQTEAPPEPTLVSTEAIEKTKSTISNGDTATEKLESKKKDDEVKEEPVKPIRRRPTLRKQKASIPETDSPIIIEISKPELSAIQRSNLENDVTEKDYLTLPKLGIIKQSSLNDELIYLDRVVENEKIKQSIQKQSSLNEDLIYGNKTDEFESLRERILRSQYKHLQVIKEGFQRLRTASLDRFDFEAPESLKNNIVKLLTSWRHDIPTTKDASVAVDNIPDEDKDGCSMSDSSETLSLKFATEYKRRVQTYCTNRQMSDSNDISNGELEKKILVRDPLERKLSRDDGSDSSKENSLQSDTSLDSEDSCVSVIFVPKPGQSSSTGFDKERNISVSSESSEGSDKPNSPKSPKSPKSPGGGRYFSTGKFLGTKMSRSNSTTSPPSNSAIECRRTSPPSTDLNRISPPSGESTLVTGSASISLPSTSETIIEEDIVPLLDSEMPVVKTESSSISRPTQCNTKSIIKLSPIVVPSTYSIKTDVCQTSSYKKDQIKCVNEKIHHETTLLKVTTTPASSSGRTFSKHNHKSVRRKTCSNSLVPPPIPPFRTVKKIQCRMIKSDHSANPGVTISEKFRINRIPKFEPKTLKRDVDKNVINVKKTEIVSTKNVQLVRKSGPRYLTFEVFNPETDDLDSDSSASSSPHSGSSVIERGWPTEKEINELDREIKRKEEEERLKPVSDPSIDNLNESEEFPKISLVEAVQRMDTISEEAQNSDSREQSPREQDFFKKCSLQRLSSSMNEDSSPNIFNYSSLDETSHPSSFKFSHYTSPSSINSVAFTNVSLPSSENRTSVKIKSLFPSSPSFRRSGHSEESRDLATSVSNSSANSTSLQPYQRSPSTTVMQLTDSSTSSSPSTQDRNRTNIQDSLNRERTLSSEITLINASVSTIPLNPQIKPLASDPKISISSKPLLTIPYQKPLITQCAIGQETQQVVPCSFPSERKSSADSTSKTRSSSKEHWVTNSSPLAADSSLLAKNEVVKSYGTLKLPDVTASVQPLHNIPKTTKFYSHTELLQNTLNAAITDVEHNKKIVKSDPTMFVRDDIFKDSTQTILTDSTNDSLNFSPSLQRQSSDHKRSLGQFELPSFIQSFLGSTVGASRDRYRNDLSGPTIEDSLVSLTKVDSKKRKSNVGTDKNAPASSVNLEREKMNRSESSLPLLCCDDTASDLLTLDDVKNQYLFLPEMRNRSDSSASVASNSTSSTTTSRKVECRHCKREEENRKKKFLQSELSKADPRLLKSKRELLRPQGSLDSAQDKQSSGKSSWFELSRSGSLDLEAATKLRETSSRDGSPSTSQDSLQSDIGGAPTLHRYYHVFKEGELDQLIEKYVHNLHIIASYYDHANWCIIAEKVRVWTI